MKIQAFSQYNFRMERPEIADGLGIKSAQVGHSVYLLLFSPQKTSQIIISSSMMLIKLKSVLLLFLAAFVLSCSKGGSNPNPPVPPAEENLLIGIDPDPGADIAKTLGSSYDFKVLVKSKMPEKGVEGTVVFRKEFDNSLISTQNISGTSSPINVTISNIVLNEVHTVTIELKSKSKPTNTASKTFKLARK